MPEETSPSTPPLHRSKLSDEVIAARVEANRRDAVLAQQLAPGIEAQLTTYGMAFDALEESHQRIADTTDLDLVGDTRRSAVWQLAGRCISLARGLWFSSAPGSPLRRSCSRERFTRPTGCLMPWPTTRSRTAGDLAR